MKLILLAILFVYASGDMTNSNLQCNNGVHRVFVTKYGVELVYMKKQQPKIYCKAIFIFPRGYGFKIDCPEVHISEGCKHGKLMFKEKSMGDLGEVCGEKPGYSMMKESKNPSMKYKLMVKFSSDGGHYKNCFKCSIMPYGMGMKPMGPETTTMAPTTTTTTTTTTTIHYFCEDADAEIVGDKCLALLNDATGFGYTGAKSECETVTGRTIADIDSAEKQSYAETAGAKTWIGLTRASSSAEFEWENLGTEVRDGYDNWDTSNSEPGSNYNCGVLDSSASNLWAEEDCSVTLNDFVCQSEISRALSFSCVTGDLIDHNKCIHIISGPADQSTSKSSCQGVNMEGADVYSEEIQQYIIDNAGGDIWIGAERATGGDPFAWPTAERVDAGYQNWVVAGPGSTHSCAIASAADGYKWTENDCTDSTIGEIVCLGPARGSASP